MIRGPLLLEVAWYASSLHARQHPLSVACTCGDTGTLDAHVRFRDPRPLLHLDVANSLPFSSLSRGLTEAQLHKLTTMFTFSGKCRLFVFPSLPVVSLGGFTWAHAEAPFASCSKHMSLTQQHCPSSRYNTKHFVKPSVYADLFPTRSEPLRMPGCKLCCARSSVCWTFHTCFV